MPLPSESSPVHELGVSPADARMAHADRYQSGARPAAVDEPEIPLDYNVVLANRARERDGFGNGDGSEASCSDPTSESGSLAQTPTPPPRSGSLSSGGGSASGAGARGSSGGFHEHDAQCPQHGGHSQQHTRAKIVCHLFESEEVRSL